MQLSLWICLAIVFVNGLELLADGLNLKSFPSTLPEEFRGAMKPEDFLKSREYQIARTRFAIVSQLISTAALIAFLLCGGFGWADSLARGWMGDRAILTGLIFAGILSVLKFVLQLPFSIYSTFVIEERFGFNRTTPATFIKDLALGAVLGTVIGAPIFASLIWFFQETGSLGWLWAWIALTVFQLFLAFIAPVVIMPLFNKYQPVPESELKTAMKKYFESQSFVVQEVYTMDGSKRSTKANAFFTGFGKFRRLVLFDTLIAKHSQDELLAVLAHEVGHFKLGHIPRTILLSILGSGVMLFLFSKLILNPSLFEAFQVATPSVYASLILISVVFGPAMKPLSILTHALSRKHEYEADEFAAKTWGKPLDLVNALKRLSSENLSHLTPTRLKVWLDYTHPPILERIARLRG